jgi:penicillin-binding protein 1A
VRWLVNLLVLMMTGAVFAGIGGLALLSYYSKDLPDYEQLEDYAPPHVTRLYSADGRILEEYATERRMFVPITAIPKRLQQAFISAEDRNFYQHPGIDVIGVGRAVVTNLSNIGSGRSLVGGSTITQQVVKNFLLTSEKSFERKLKEAILSFRISKSFSKKKILELYLNEIYLGAGSYGVAAAALNYFNRSIDELSIAESAFLAGLPKAPSHYNPRRNYERAKTRRDWVITRMQEDGYITAEEAGLAIRTPIALRDREALDGANATHFAEEVRRTIVREYGNDTLYEGGLAVHTTLEPNMQAMAEKALMNGVLAYDRRHGYRGPLKHFSKTSQWRKKLGDMTKPSGTEGWRLAMVLSVKGDAAGLGLDDGTRGALAFGDASWAQRYSKKTGWGKKPETIQDVVKIGDVILVEAKPAQEDEAVTRYQLRQIPEVDGALVALDPHTGRVIAMVGGAGFRNVEFNRATQARRQPGSAFKTFVYLAALENGLNPSSIILDAPIELEQGPGLPLWKPQNYSGKFYGPTTVRMGLEKSINVMTVRMAQMLGLERVREAGLRFGAYESLPLNYSMVLGAQETLLMDITTAYAMIVNGGKKVTPKLIERIQDRMGRLIYRSDERVCDGCKYATDGYVSDVVPRLEDTRDVVTDPLTAYQVTSILEGVVKRGTGLRARSIGKPVGGKTGTTNDSVDSWFIGFTPDLVCGVFMGFDQPRSLGRKETGSSVALPVFVEFMSSALQDEPSTPFRIPPGIKLVKVDRYTGLPPTFESRDADIIFEAFKPGTEPGIYAATPNYQETTIPAYDPVYQPSYQPPLRRAPDRSPPVLEQPERGSPDIIQPQRRNDRHTPTLGTGGIY